MTPWPRVILILAIIAPAPRGRDLYSVRLGMTFRMPAVELRGLFPRATDNTPARACARTIAGWKTPPLLHRTKLHPGKRRWPARSPVPPLPRPRQPRRADRVRPHESTGYSAPTRRRGGG
jgi:hypothetical protein